VWLFEPDRPALVLGSGQRSSPPPATGGVHPAVLDEALAAREGVDIVRRRSGGAAVLLEPGGVVWADVIVPRGHALWDDDVGRATWWVGAWWQRALATLGVDTEVHRGAMVRNRWSSVICFAGIGPGEVLAGGRKVVGVSQRRTRSMARFQTAALLHWRPPLLAALCGIAPLGRPLERVLVDGAVGLGDLQRGLDVSSVQAALLAALPLTD
jgi:lipoate-protein ligase A